MVETRVYITNDLSMKNVNNNVFIDHCEMEGGIYSLEGFQNAWNNGDLDFNNTIIRIIDIDIPSTDERILGFNYNIPSNTKDSDNGVVEWCPECDCEVLLQNVFKTQICPNCGKPILPCAQCKDNNCTNCPLIK